MAFSVDSIRADFPILKIKMNGKKLVYLDSAATSQKPKQVLESMDYYYRNYNANIHRGIYKIAERATEEYIDSKKKIAKFINADSIEEIIYVRNTTEAINLVSLAWGNANVKKGDHILISEMEHHSNIVPWMLLAKRKGAILDFIKLDKTNSRLDMDSFNKMLEKKPKIVAVTHVSNVLGTINNIKEIIKRAHKNGAFVLIDAAQSVPHMQVDVKELDCDFFAFSAHKMLGPTGIGVLYAKREILENMEPLFGGGDMIRTVQYDSYSWNDLPWKFEAGTSDVAGGIGFGAAIDYLNKVGIGNIRKHEKELTKYALEELDNVKGIKVYGLNSKNMDERAGVITFSMDKVHPHDVAQIFDSEGIAIRSGHHCAMPLVTERLMQPALSRISFYLYNDKSEVDAAIKALGKVKSTFRIK
ncbi:MAG: cysteine desulfurase [Candidatus Micrarchaeaceae archaeon]|jgi:cysteine desulfurase / selenocysteine lyase